MAGAVESEVVDFRGELFAGELLAFDGEGDDERIVTNMFGDAFALFGLDLPFESVAGMLRCLLVGHFDDVELAIPAQSFRIFRDGVAQILLFDLADGDQCDFHEFPLAESADDALRHSVFSSCGVSR